MQNKKENTYSEAEANPAKGKPLFYRRRSTQEATQDTAAAAAI